MTFLMESPKARRNTRIPQLPEMATRVSAPVIATRPEFMRRMKDMAAHGGLGSFYGTMPEEVTLTVNGNHPVFDVILKSDGEHQQKKVCLRVLFLWCYGQ